MLLPQTHSPEVDYSLFMVETVEMSMEMKETTPAAPRRSFPLQSAAPDLRFRVFVIWRRLFSRTPWDFFYRRFKVKTKAVEERSTAAELRGPKWWAPRGQVQGPRGPPPFGLPGSVCLIPSLLRLLPSKIMTSVFFHIFLTMFGSLKHKRKKIGFSACAGLIP